MNPVQAMNFVFCSDRRMLGGLHVAAMSVLQTLDTKVEKVAIWVFSDDLQASDEALLRETLDSVGRPYSLRMRQVNVDPLVGFPKLAGSLGTYYRLLIPRQIQAERYLYLDVDTLCRIDLSPLMEISFAGNPIGLCPECPMSATLDAGVREVLGPAAGGNYYNAGVMLVDRQQWEAEQVTERCFEFLSKHHAPFWDQSAINAVLVGQITSLPEQFNCYTNVRANWPALKDIGSGEDRFLHFTDYPKPWSRFGRWVHPFGKHWWAVYRETALWRVSPRAKSYGKGFLHQVKGYKKVMKDRLLFEGYRRGWFLPKGVSAK